MLDGFLDNGGRFSHRLPDGRQAWIYAVSGQLTVGCGVRPAHARCGDRDHRRGRSRSRNRAGIRRDGAFRADGGEADPRAVRQARAAGDVDRGGCPPHARLCAEKLVQARSANNVPPERNRQSPERGTASRPTLRWSRRCPAYRQSPASVPEALQKVLEPRPPLRLIPGCGQTAALDVAHRPEEG